MENNYDKLFKGIKDITIVVSVLKDFNLLDIYHVEIVT